MGDVRILVLTTTHNTSDWPTSRMVGILQSQRINPRRKTMLGIPLIVGDSSRVSYGPINSQIAPNMKDVLNQLRPVMPVSPKINSQFELFNGVWDRLKLSGRRRRLSRLCFSGGKSLKEGHRSLALHLKWRLSLEVTLLPRPR